MSLGTGVGDEKVVETVRVIAALLDRFGQMPAYLVRRTVHQCTDINGAKRVAAAVGIAVRRMVADGLCTVHHPDGRPMVISSDKPGKVPLDDGAIVRPCHRGNAGDDIDWPVSVLVYDTLRGEGRVVSRGYLGKELRVRYGYTDGNLGAVIGTLTDHGLAHHRRIGTRVYCWADGVNGPGSVHDGEGA